MKTKFTSTRFGGKFGTLRFDEKSFFITFLRFTRFCDYKLFNAIHADSPGVYTSEKILILSTIDEDHLKCDVIDGSGFMLSIFNGLRQSIPFSFVSDKPSGYKVF